MEISCLNDNYYVVKNYNPSSEEIHNKILNYGGRFEQDTKEYIFLIKNEKVKKIILDDNKKNISSSSSEENSTSSSSSSEEDSNISSDDDYFKFKKQKTLYREKSFEKINN